MGKQSAITDKDPSSSSSTKSRSRSRSIKKEAVSSEKNPIVRDDSNQKNYEEISPSAKQKHRGRSKLRKKGSRHSHSRKSSPRDQKGRELESLPHNKEGSRERMEESTSTPT